MISDFPPLTLRHCGGGVPFFLWKGLQARRREGTGQREFKAQPAQASTSTTKKPKPSEPRPQKWHT